MNDGLNKLKEIGTQKIYEQTHISKVHIQAILHNSFENLTKVQIIGFISILEREYKVDLSETIEIANTYFNQLSKNEENVNKEIFVAVREVKGNNNALYIVIIIFILSLALYFSLKDSIIVDEEIDNTLIKNVKEKVMKEENITKIVISPKELNVTQIDIQASEIKKIEIIEDEKLKNKVTIKSLNILPKTKVWVGYINIDNNKHYQIVVKKSLELDANKNWLFLFGHNQVEFEINNQIVATERSIRFSYIDSKIKAITLEEFKKLNKGSKW